MLDPYHLQRFVEAQDPVYRRVREELRAGRKTTHWMWFIFPQIAGLGYSSTAREFAIASLNEAVAYLQHPLLGARLRECAALVSNIEGSSAEQIFGAVDALKLQSSMTLFAEAAADNATFLAVLDKYFGGRRDSATLARI